MTAVLIVLIVASFLALPFSILCVLYGQGRRRHRSWLRRHLFAEKTWRETMEQKRIEYEVIQRAIFPKRLRKRGDRRSLGAITIVDDADRGALSVSEDARGGLTKSP